MKSSADNMLFMKAGMSVRKTFVVILDVFLPF